MRNLFFYVLFSFFIPLAAKANLQASVACDQVFLAGPSKVDFKLQLSSKLSVKYLYATARTRVEFPRENFQFFKNYAELTLSRRQFESVFRTEFEEVVIQLREDFIYRTETSTGWSIHKSYDAPVLQKWGVRQENGGEEVFYLQIDIRVANLMAMQKDPGSAAMYLESGLVGPQGMYYSAGY